MTIRWRLTFWFTLILGLILILSGVFVHTLFQHHLHGEIDDNLKIASARVHGTLHLDEIPEPVDYDVIHSSLPPINEFASPGIYIQLIDRQGNVVAKSVNLGDQILPVNMAFIERGFAGDVEIATFPAYEGSDVRMMVSPLFLNDETLLLEVGQSLQQTEGIMSQLRWMFLAGILLAVALAIVSGAFLARRALAPVGRITRTARGIEASSDLTRRVDYSGPMDEVGRLAETFDHMIDHLDRVFKAQKDFVADASHDLRGPLTVIGGNLDLLRRNLSEDDRQESIDIMRKGIERMTAILDDLLLLAEIEGGQPDQPALISTRELLLEILAQSRQQTSAHRILEGGVEDSVVKGNRHRLGLALSNLVGNAIKYTPDGGDITLSAFSDGPWMRLEVGDTGPGIEAEHLPHLFDRFYRTDKARSRKIAGTGLGLAIVKGIVETHAGKVSVASEIGKGSTFTLWLKL